MEGDSTEIHRNELIEYIEKTDCEYLELYEDGERVPAFFTQNGNIILDQDGMYTLDTFKLLTALINDIDNDLSITSYGTPYRIININQYGRHLKVSIKKDGD